MENELENAILVLFRVLDLGFKVLGFGLAFAWDALSLPSVEKTGNFPQSHDL